MLHTSPRNLLLMTIHMHAGACAGGCAVVAAASVFGVIT